MKLKGLEPNEIHEIMKRKSLESQVKFKEGCETGVWCVCGGWMAPLVWMKSKPVKGLQINKKNETQITECSNETGNRT